MNPMVLSAIRHAVLVECLAQRAVSIADSNHFVLYDLHLPDQSPGQFGNIIVVHKFTPSHIDNNIGYSVANELLPLLAAGVHDLAGYAEQEIFERYVGAIVRSIDSDERQAWHLFYTNTLQRLSQNAPPVRCTELAKPYNFIENFGAIYQRICHLVDAIPPMGPLEARGYTILDVATCFGFFPFFLANAANRLASTPTRIVGCDINPALVALARDYARQPQFNCIEFVMADILTSDSAALQRRFQAATFDVVTAIHLLEHLEAAQITRAVANLWQLTRQRLIIAVPLEELPDARFGHLQTFNREKLLALGQHIAGRCQYDEYHGGWLVVDRMIDQTIDRAAEPGQSSEPWPTFETVEFGRGH